MNNDQLLMPKATAVWLVDNTPLTFEQIAKFCGLHVFEVQAIADGQAAIGMKGVDPIALCQLTAEEIERCSKDPTAELKKMEYKREGKVRKTKRYTPLTKRHDRPDAILWLLKNHPELSDSQICFLLSTTRTTINSIKQKQHPRMQDIQPKSPVALGFCTQEELDEAVTKAAGNPQQPS